MGVATKALRENSKGTYRIQYSLKIQSFLERTWSIPQTTRQLHERIVSAEDSQMVIFRSSHSGEGIIGSCAVIQAGLNLLRPSLQREE